MLVITVLASILTLTPAQAKETTRDVLIHAVQCAEGSYSRLSVGKYGDNKTVYSTYDVCRTLETDYAWQMRCRFVEAKLAIRQATYAYGLATYEEAYEIVQVQPNNGPCL